MKKTCTYLLLFIFTFISTFTPYSVSANTFPPPTFNNDMMQQQQQMNDQMQRQQQDLDNQMSQQQQDLEQSMREMEEQNRELMRQQQEEMLRNMSFQEQMNEFARQMQENTIKATFTIGATSMVLTFPDPKEELIDLGTDILWDLFWEFVTEGILGIIFDGEHTPEIPEEETSGTDPPIKEVKPESPENCDCFSAGTLILTGDNNTKPIEQFKDGDKVLSRDKRTGNVTVKEVTEVKINTTSTIYKIKIGEEEIITTYSHPFWAKTYGGTTTWVEAHNLDNSYSFWRYNKFKNKRWEKIDEVEEIKLKSPIKVYNLEVKNNNSYFVTKAGYGVLTYRIDYYPIEKYNAVLDKTNYFYKKGKRETHLDTKKGYNPPKSNYNYNPSKKLGTSLEKAGLTKPTIVTNKDAANIEEIINWEAHHIIPTNGVSNEVKKFLWDHDIDLNSAANGVWLPKVKTYKDNIGKDKVSKVTHHKEHHWKSKISVHNGNHSDIYYDYISERVLELKIDFEDTDAYSTMSQEERKREIISLINELRAELLSEKLSVHQVENIKP